MSKREKIRCRKAGRLAPVRPRLAPSALVITVLSVIWMGTAGASLDPPLSVKAQVDRQQAYVGDVIGFTITLIADSATSIDSVPMDQNLGDFEVTAREYNVSSYAAGLLQHTIRFSLAAYQTGLIWIPQVPVRFVRGDGAVTEMLTDSLGVVIMSVASGDSLVDIRGLKPPIYFGGHLRWLYLALAAAILLGLLLWFWRKKKAPEAAREAAPLDTRPPWVIAEEAMTRLRESGLLANGEFKLFYSRLTEILRAYIEPRFGVDALDRTTSELRSEMSRINIDDRFCVPLFKLFDSADLVKFAKFEPTTRQAEGDFQLGWQFIQDTTQKHTAGVTGA